MICSVAPARKVMMTNLVLPTAMMNRAARRGQKIQPADTAARAGNEVIVEAVGGGDELAKLGIKAGDRIAIEQIMCPIVVNCKQMLIISAHHVLAKVENWNPEDKVKPAL